jgi:alpha-N-arabinofuranosidase
MMKKRMLTLVLVPGLASLLAAGPSITIDAVSPDGKVSPLSFALMTEEINHSYDGGLYAERAYRLVRVTLWSVAVQLVVS